MLKKGEMVLVTVANGSATVALVQAEEDIDIEKEMRASKGYYIVDDFDRDIRVRRDIYLKLINDGKLKEVNFAVHDLGMNRIQPTDRTTNRFGLVDYILKFQHASHAG